MTNKNSLNEVRQAHNNLVHADPTVDPTEHRPLRGKRLPNRGLGSLLVHGVTPKGRAKLAEETREYGIRRTELHASKVLRGQRAPDDDLMQRFRVGDPDAVAQLEGRVYDAELADSIAESRLHAEEEQRVLAAKAAVRVTARPDLPPNPPSYPRPEHRRAPSRYGMGARVGALVLVAAAGITGIAKGASAGVNTYDTHEAHKAAAVARDQRHFEHVIGPDIQLRGQQFVSAFDKAHGKGWTEQVTPDGKFVMLQEPNQGGNSGEAIMSYTVRHENGRTEIVPSPKDTIWADWQSGNGSISTIGGIYETAPGGVAEAQDMQVQVPSQVEVQGWGDYQMTPDVPGSDTIGLGSNLPPDHVNWNTQGDMAQGVVTAANQTPPFGST